MFQVVYPNNEDENQTLWYSYFYVPFFIRYFLFYNPLEVETFRTEEKSRSIMLIVVSFTQQSLFLLIVVNLVRLFV